MEQVLIQRAVELEVEDFHSVRGATLAQLTPDIAVMVYGGGAGPGFVIDNGNVHLRAIRIVNCVPEVLGPPVTLAFDWQLNFVWDVCTLDATRGVATWLDYVDVPPHENPSWVEAGRFVSTANGMAAAFEVDPDTLEITVGNTIEWAPADYHLNGETYGVPLEASHWPIGICAMDDEFVVAMGAYLLGDDEGFNVSHGNHGKALRINITGHMQVSGITLSNVLHNGQKIIEWEYNSIITGPDVDEGAFRFGERWSHEIVALNSRVAVMIWDRSATGSVPAAWGGGTLTHTPLTFFRIGNDGKVVNVGGFAATAFKRIDTDTGRRPRNTSLVRLAEDLLLVTWEEQSVAPNPLNRWRQYAMAVRVTGTPMPMTAADLAAGRVEPLASTGHTQIEAGPITEWGDDNPGPTEQLGVNVNGLQALWTRNKTFET